MGSSRLCQYNQYFRKGCSEKSGGRMLRYSSAKTEHKNPVKGSSIPTITSILGKPNRPVLTVSVITLTLSGKNLNNITLGKLFNNHKSAATVTLSEPTKGSNT